MARIAQTEAPEWRFFAPRTLLVPAVLAVISAGIAISPPVARLAHDFELVHFVQHAAIFIPGLVVGAAVRDLFASPPMPIWVAITIGGASLIGDIATLAPPLGTAIETNATLHDTQHGIVFACGFLMGLALRDILVAGRGPRART